MKHTHTLQNGFTKNRCYCSKRRKKEEEKTSALQTVEVESENDNIICHEKRNKINHYSHIN
jgi:hypothetical protein